MPYPPYGLILNVLDWDFHPAEGASFTCESCTWLMHVDVLVGVEVDYISWLLLKYQIIPPSGMPLLSHE